ncbi:MAG: hypothetical protein ACTSRZ_20445, partial [Promethearchaeota archaeon]
MDTKKYISIFLALILTSIVLLFFRTVYIKIDEEIQTDYLRKSSDYYRDIDTLFKKWLNGHLGIFFRFKYFGNINWLAIPLFIYFLITIRKREKWQAALAFVYLSTVIILAIKGYQNWRYQFTLYPFTIAMVMFLGWEFLKRRDSIIKLGILVLLGTFLLYNFYHYFSYYKYQWTNKVNIINKDYPTQILEYINSIASPTFTPVYLICCSDHIFFYYSNNKGLDYYNPEYKHKIRRKNRKQLYSFLKNELKVTHIFSNWRVEESIRPQSLGEILSLDCKQIMSDEVYRLYRLREKPLEDELQSKAYAEYKVWNYEAE